MASAFRELGTQDPQRYFQVQHCATFDDVKNGGPPFQIDGNLFANWYEETMTRCPVMLRHLMSFLQSKVAYDDRTSPIPKNPIQPYLRIHAAAFLTVSPATSRMTIATALQKLLKYAKIFGSEAVTNEMVSFVDPLIYKYLTNELQEVTVQLEDVRKQLQLADECCELVVKRNDFVQAVMNWRKAGESYYQIHYLSSPTSLSDADAAKSQLKELNVLLMDLVEVYTTSVAKIQSWTETARTHALSFERQRYQDAADNESSILQDKHDAVFKQYAAWCPYLHNFAQLCICSTK
jgi:hypothetical protein